MAAVTIVILGAGDVGGALARDLAVRNLVSRVVLVDDHAQAAAGKALDIAQAGPIDAYTTSVSATGDASVVVGAAMVAVADRVEGPAEWQGDAGLALVRRVVELNTKAPILCVGHAQTTLIERGVTELAVPRHRLFGSAPEALKAAVAAIVGLEADAAPDEVALTLVGRLPAEIIVPWEQVTVGGRRIVDLLPQPALARIEGRLQRLWPPGPATLGAAAARLMTSMITRAPRTCTVLAATTREEGTPGRAAILPARLHAGGILRILPLALSGRDRVRFETAVAR
jgi:malate dehydrogenase